MAEARPMASGRRVVRVTLHVYIRRQDGTDLQARKGLYIRLSFLFLLDQVIAGVSNTVLRLKSPQLIQDVGMGFEVMDVWFFPFCSVSFFPNHVSSLRENLVESKLCEVPFKRFPTVK